MMFYFDICHPVGNVLKHHQEEQDLPGDAFAYRHFRKLLEQYPPCGYYYLCEWGLGTLAEYKARPIDYSDWGGV